MRRLRERTGKTRRAYRRLDCNGSKRQARCRTQMPGNDGSASQPVEARRIFASDILLSVVQPILFHDRNLHEILAIGHIGFCILRVFEGIKGGGDPERLFAAVH